MFRLKFSLFLNTLDGVAVISPYIFNTTVTNLCMHFIFPQRLQI